MYIALPEPGMVAFLACTSTGAGSVGLNQRRILLTQISYVREPITEPV